MQVSFPLGLSPTAMHRLAHPDGELATSRAAAKNGICMGLSSYATESLENVAAQGTGNPYVMQMCVLKDREITLQLLRRAEGKTAPLSLLMLCEIRRWWLILPELYSCGLQGAIPLRRCPRARSTPQRVQEQVRASGGHGIPKHSIQRQG